MARKDPQKGKKERQSWAKWWVIRLILMALFIAVLLGAAIIWGIYSK